MNQFLHYFAWLLTVLGAMLTFLQSVYLIWLRLGLFPFYSQSLTLEALAIKQKNIAFIQGMLTLLFISSAIEVSLFWLLVVLNLISQRYGLIATLILVILVGFISLFVFSAFVFEK